MDPTEITFAQEQVNYNDLMFRANALFANAAEITGDDTLRIQFNQLNPTPTNQPAATHPAVFPPNRQAEHEQLMTQIEQINQTVVKAVDNAIQKIDRFQNEIENEKKNNPPTFLRSTKHEPDIAKTIVEFMDRSYEKIENTYNNAASLISNMRSVIDLTKEKVIYFFALALLGFSTLKTMPTHLLCISSSVTLIFLIAKNKWINRAKD